MADTVEEQRQQLIHAIGQCITAWAVVERAMTVLYCECVGSPVGEPNFWLHASIFDSVISIGARLDMIQAALRSITGLLLNPKMATPQLLINWKSLRNTIERKYDKRNEVAHSDIQQKGMKDGTQSVRLAVFPVLSGTFKGHKSLDIIQLNQRANDFEEFSGHIVVFSNQVRITLVTPPATF